MRLGDADGIGGKNKTGRRRKAPDIFKKLSGNLSAPQLSEPINRKTTWGTQRRDDIVIDTVNQCLLLNVSCRRSPFDRLQICLLYTSDAADE